MYAMAMSQIYQQSVQQQGVWLASFPGLSHLQYLIAYSMQIQRGKAWEIWSRVVMSGRQKVDTRRGGVRRGISKPFLVLSV